GSSKGARRASTRAFTTPAQSEDRLREKKCAWRSTRTGATTPSVDHDEYLEHSKRLCAILEQMARDDMRDVHPEFYRLTVEDHRGSGAVVVERVQPPHRHV